MEKRLGFFGTTDPASDESLREERRQVEGRERRSVHGRRVKPAGHVSKYQVSGVMCQVWLYNPAVVEAGRHLLTLNSSQRRGAR